MAKKAPTKAPAPKAPAPNAPSKSGDAVVFHIWQSLNYRPRVMISFALVVAGFAVQAALYYFASLNLFVDFITGAPLVFFGSALLWVRGYDNRIDFSHFDPAASWETVERRRLTQIGEMDKAIQRWDARLLDITNWRGALLFLGVLLLLGALLVIVPGLFRVLVLNAVMLLLPQWFTGTTRIMRLPKLLVKTKATDDLLNAIAPEIKDLELQVLMLLKGKERQIPDDVKFRLSFPGQDPGFMGLYGQVVTNDVQGSSYPYFYTVIVAKTGYGLPTLLKQLQNPAGMDVEGGGQDEVEFIVVRQHTTKTSGYHTDLPAAVGVFAAGLAVARAAQAMPRKPHK